MDHQHRESRRSWRNLAHRFWQDERGQSTTEYILILSVVVMVAMKFKSTFQKQMQSAVDKLGDNMEKALEE